MNSDFTCACCRRAFTRAIPLEEAHKEYEREFSIPAASAPWHGDEICDECWQQFRKWLAARQERN